MYICIVWSQSSFGQHLLCIFNNYTTMCLGRIKHRKLYIWSMFTWVKRSFGTANPNRVTWLPVRFMHQRLFPCTFHPIPWEYLCDSTGKFNRGWRRVIPHGINQPYLVRWQGLDTLYYPYTVCYWNIMCTFFKWPLSVPFELPMAMLGQR